MEYNNNKLSYINFRIPTKTKEDIEKLANNLWITTSDICRLSIKEYLEKHNTETRTITNQEI